MANALATVGPLASRADLATKLGPVVSGTSATVLINGATLNVGYTTTTATNANWANKAYAEAPIRALADVTNTRTWNLMIDLIAQTGTFSANASNLTKDFNVQGETHYWLHVAIDRFTGQVVDESLEQVPDGPILNPAAVTDNLPAGATVGVISASSSTSASNFTYSLVSGSGSDDNASFTISGNTLQTAATFQYLAQSTYKVRIRATDQNGLVLEQPYLVTVVPSAYTQWKMTNFQGYAGTRPSPATRPIPPGTEFRIFSNTLWA